jgi:hypothetical protein
MRNEAWLETKVDCCLSFYNATGEMVQCLEREASLRCAIGSNLSDRECERNAAIAPNQKNTPTYGFNNVQTGCVKMKFSL